MGNWYVDVIDQNDGLFNRGQVRLSFSVDIERERLQDMQGALHHLIACAIYVADEELIGPDTQV